MAVESIRFKTHIEKDHIIKIPESLSISEGEAEVIVFLQEPSDKDRRRWEKWIEDKVLSGGVIEKWKREEIYVR